MIVLRIRKPLPNGQTYVSRSNAPTRSYGSVERARLAVSVL